MMPSHNDRRRPDGEAGRRNDLYGIPSIVTGAPDSRSPDTRSDELGLLDCAMQTPSITVTVGIEPDHFAAADRGAIWAALREIHRDGLKPEPTTVLERAQRHARVDPAIFTELYGWTVPIDAERYAANIRDGHARRTISDQLDRARQLLGNGAPVTAVLAELRPEELDIAPSARGSWQPVDLSDVLAGTWRAPEPTVGQRSDGVGLFYPGKVHTVSSESEAGKTWLVLSAVIDELKAGNHVVYLDFEDDEGGVTGRLLTLGCPHADIRDRFHYIRPEEPIGSSVHQLAALLADTTPTLGIVDGVTEAMTLHGLDPLSNKDAAIFGRMLPRRLANAGAASVSLDHVPKSTENRGRYSIGAVHKLNGLDGAAYVLDNRSPFGVGITGRSTLRIAKDRPGQLRRHAFPSAGGLHWFGDLILTSHDQEFAEVEIKAPEDRTDGFKPTVYMGRIMAAIAERGPLSKRLIRAAVTGKTATVDAALDRLILDKYLTETSPHAVLKPWTEPEEVTP